MQYVTLNTGEKMPQLGFGVYQIPVAETESILAQAIKTGYRHFDTAQYYGNEAGVGKAINTSGLPRKEFFMTTKLATSGYRETKQQIERALNDLEMDEIDLMLIHWVVPDYLGTWEALVEAHRAGKIRSIGLSNFQPQMIEEIRQESGITPAVLQNEMHVFQQQVATRRYCKEVGIQFESWAPFGEGRKGIFANPVLTIIGQQYGKTAAQVILRFMMQEGVVAIPKSANPERMAQNFAIFDFELNQKDIEMIRKMDTGRGLFGWND